MRGISRLTTLTTISKPITITTSDALLLSIAEIERVVGWDGIDFIGTKIVPTPTWHGLC